MNSSLFLSLCFITSVCFAAGEYQTPAGESLSISIDELRERIEHSASPLVSAQRAALMSAFGGLEAELMQNSLKDGTLFFLNSFIQLLNVQDEQKMREALGQWLESYHSGIFLNAKIDKKILEPLAHVIEELVPVKETHYAARKNNWKKLLGGAAILLSAGVAGWYFSHKGGITNGSLTTRDENNDSKTTTSSPGMGAGGTGGGQVVLSSLLPSDRESTFDEEVINEPESGEGIRTFQAEAIQGDNSTLSSPALPLQIGCIYSSRGLLGNARPHIGIYMKGQSPIYPSEYSLTINAFRDFPSMMKALKGGMPEEYIRKCFSAASSLGEYSPSFIENALELGSYFLWKKQSEKLSNAPFSSDMTLISLAYPDLLARLLESVRHSSVLETFAVYKKLQKNVLPSLFPSQSVEAFFPVGFEKEHYYGCVGNSVTTFLSCFDLIERVVPLSQDNNVLYNYFLTESYKEKVQDAYEMMSILQRSDEDTTISDDYKEIILKWKEREHRKNTLRQWLSQYRLISTLKEEQQYNECQEQREYESAYDDMLNSVSNTIAFKAGEMQKTLLFKVRSAFADPTHSFDKRAFCYHLYTVLCEEYDNEVQPSEESQLVVGNRNELRDAFIVPSLRENTELYTREQRDIIDRIREQAMEAHVHPYFFTDQAISFSSSEKILHSKYLIEKYFLRWFVELERKAHFFKLCGNIPFDQLQKKSKEWYDLLDHIEFDPCEGERYRKRLVEESQDIIKELLIDFQDDEATLSFLKLCHSTLKKQRSSTSLLNNKTKSNSDLFFLPETFPRSYLDNTSIMSDLAVIDSIRTETRYKEWRESPFYDFYKIITQEVKNYFITREEFEDQNYFFSLEERFSLSQAVPDYQNLFKDLEDKYTADTNALVEGLDNCKSRYIREYNSINSFNELADEFASLSTQEAIVKEEIELAKKWHARTQEALDALLILAQKEESGSHRREFTSAAAEVARRSEHIEKRKRDRMWREAFMQACQRVLEVPRGLDACRCMVVHEMKRLEGTEEEKGIKACAYLFDPHKEHAEKEAFWRDMQSLYTSLFNGATAATCAAYAQASSSDQVAMPCSKKNVKRFINICEYLACQKALQPEPMPADEQGAYPFSFSGQDQDDHLSSEGNGMQAGGGY